MSTSLDLIAIVGAAALGAAALGAAALGATMFGVTALVVVPPAQAWRFTAARIDADGSALVLSTSAGGSVRAPRDSAQDAYSDAEISQDGRYAGWLAGYSGVGTSYSQPVDLVVMDRHEHLHTFGGTFGTVTRWCFWPARSAVAYAYAFPHGPSATVFALRRIDDEGRLATYDIAGDGPRRARQIAGAPQWVRCIPDWQSR